MTKCMYLVASISISISISISRSMYIASTSSSLVASSLVVL